MPTRKKPSSKQALEAPPSRLEDLPNIGRSLASDLRALGIQTPQDLALSDPKTVFAKLIPVMGHRHDPCVFYTLLAVKHFFQSQEALPWWKFTAEGKTILQAAMSQVSR